MDLHRGALLVGDSAAGVLNERLERLPGGAPDDHLDHRAHVDDALHHARDAVRPRRRPVLFELDALRSDDDLRLPGDVAVRSARLELVAFQRDVAGARAGIDDGGLHEVRHAEEVGDVERLGILVDVLRRPDLLDVPRFMTASRSLIVSASSWSWVT